MWRESGVALILVVASGLPASALKLNAVCRDISGVRLDDTGSKLEMSRDGLTDVSWSYTADEETHQGILILQSSKSAGGKPKAERALAQRMLSGHWSFVSVLKDATWVHSIYPASGRLLVTQNTSTGLGTASGKMLTGTCRATED